jgi:hypothetical protein
LYDELAKRDGKKNHERFVVGEHTVSVEKAITTLGEQHMQDVESVQFPERR